MMSKESEWCRVCGEHRLKHGETEEKVANLNRITEHEFEPVCGHHNAIPDPSAAATKNYCPECGESYFISLVQAEYVPSGPQPEFPLDELVTADVKEPKIEFNYGLCKICEIPLTEEYEHVSFCGDCAEDTFTLIFSGDSDEGNLPN
jgi:uncharacterized protein YuzB (UPF0349 family)